MKLPILHTVWFKVKDYGRGWYPASRQGFLILGIYVVLTCALVYVISLDPHQLNRGIARMIVASIFLILICYLTGEKPGWRWR